MLLRDCVWLFGRGAFALTRGTLALTRCATARAARARAARARAAIFGLLNLSVARA